MDKIKKINYWINLLEALDQFANAITGGYHDSTVSARIGCFANKTSSKYWKLMQLIVNSTFFILEGKDHCIRAYRADKYERFIDGNVLAKTILILGTIVICLVLVVVFSLIRLFKHIKSKHQNK